MRVPRNARSRPRALPPRGTDGKGARSRHTAVIAATSKGVPLRLSRWEFNFAAASIQYAPQVERRLIVHIVMAQIIVTAVLLVGFSVEVFFGKV